MDVMVSTNSFSVCFRKGDGYRLLKDANNFVISIIFPKIDTLHGILRRTSVCLALKDESIPSTHSVARKGTFILLSGRVGMAVRSPILKRCIRTSPLREGVGNFMTEANTILAFDKVFLVVTLTNSVATFLFLQEGILSHVRSSHVGYVSEGNVFFGIKSKKKHNLDAAGYVYFRVIYVSWSAT